MLLVKSGANPSLVKSSGEAISRTASVAIATSMTTGVESRPRAPFRRIRLTRWRAGSTLTAIDVMICAGELGLGSGGPARAGSSSRRAPGLDGRLDFVEAGQA